MNVRLASIAATAAIATTAAIGIAAPANAVPSASGLRPAPVPAAPVPAAPVETTTEETVEETVEDAPLFETTTEEADHSTGLLPSRAPEQDAPIPAVPVNLQVEDVDADHSTGLVVPSRLIETTTEAPAAEVVHSTPAQHSAPAHVEAHVTTPAPVIEAVIEDEHAAATKSATPIAASEQSPVEEVIAAVKTKRTKSGAVSKIRVGVADSLKKGEKVAAEVCTDNGCAETTGKVREKKYGKILVLNLKAPKFEKVLDTANSDSITITVKGHSVTV